MSLNLGNTHIKDIYVGSTKIKEVYQGSSKVYGLNQLFYVTVIQPNGGTITATPVKGYNGTEVILSNSPSTNYEFGGYSVTGATLFGNKFIINNSDVTVTGSFNLYQQDWVNLGSTEYTNKRRYFKHLLVITYWYAFIIYTRLFHYYIWCIFR